MSLMNEDETAGRPAGVQGEIKHLIAPWTVGSENLWLGILVLLPGGRTNAHAIPNIDGIHYTISGKGKEIIDGKEIPTRAGSCIFIPAGTMHQVVNDGTEPLKLLSVTNPPIPQPK
jgi:mannose-6-phosphate isomerase-like protein (cupin superfamily)